MSLLSIVQNALGEIGLGSPPSVVGNADVNVAQALALVNRGGIVLRDMPAAADYWPSLRKQFLFNMAGAGPFIGTFTYGSNVITGVVFTGTGPGWTALQAGWQISSKFLLPDTMIAVGGINQGAQTITMTQVANLISTQTPQTDTAVAFGQEAYPVPADLNYFVPGTGWDRNFRWQLLGPVNAQEWQVLKSGISPVGPRLRYRLMGSGGTLGTGFQSGAVTTKFFTATANQTVFVLPSPPSVLFSVSLDGSTLVSGTDFNLSQATITLTNGALAGQGLYVVYAASSSVASVPATTVQIYLQPAPFIQTGNLAPVTDLIVMEYASINWVAPSGTPGVASQQNFQLDTDVCPVFPEDLLTLSLKWRMLKAKGNAYAEEFDEYEKALQQRTGRETMARALPLNARAGQLRLINSQQVPDTGFGT